MLKSLTVRNFAVISEVRLDFKGGLSIFTGETGAGKSILIEALGFLLGARGSTEWIRAGSSRFEVEGVFEACPEAGPKGPFTLKRTLDVSGRSKAFLNGQPISLGRLSGLGDSIADFHGQHEHQTLFKPSIQLELLDRFAGLEEKRRKISQTHQERLRLQGQIDGLKLSDEERLRKIDLYRFQVQEISEANPVEGEDEELETVLPKLKNAERLRSLSEEIHQMLYAEEGAAQEILSKAEKNSQQLAHLDSDSGGISEMISQAATLVSEASHEVMSYREKIQIDPRALDEALSRQEKLSLLKKKYGPGIKDVLDYKSRSAGELEALDNLDVRSEALEKEFKKITKKLSAMCDEIHRSRTEAGGKLARRIGGELKEMGMPSVRFSVSVEMDESHFTPTGSDGVEFLMAPNPGEPLKPLRSIASAGELSRTMLGIKVVLARADKIPLLVFDEVDSGVGAVIGRSVGKKLSELSNSRQILCVTHLPQVASCGASHYRVIKRILAGKTCAEVARLEEKERLEEIARMLGGKEATPVSRRHAIELLEESMV